MDNNLKKIKTEIYNNCALEILNFRLDLESKDYDACRFELSRRHIISRSAKITPKKVGQFVTFWKRCCNGSIEPFSEADQIDLYVVNVRTENEFGQFVFPKSVLISKGILSRDNKGGKRAFRVYPQWDIVKNRQAERTQKWQLNYFYVINDLTDFKSVFDLYRIE